MENGKAASGFRPSSLGFTPLPPRSGFFGVNKLCDVCVVGESWPEQRRYPAPRWRLESPSWYEIHRKIFVLNDLDSKIQTAKGLELSSGSPKNRYGFDADRANAIWDARSGVTGGVDNFGLGAIRSDRNHCQAASKGIRGKLSHGSLHRFIAARSFSRGSSSGRNYHVDAGSSTVGFDVHSPRELENPFSHASNPDTRTCGLNF